MAFDIAKSGFGASVSNLDRIRRIPLNGLINNSKNFYTVADVEALKDSIRMIGLLSPITVVKVNNGAYRIVSGHRRYRAYQELHADEIDGNEYGEIPAIVADLDDIDELTALITANSTQRELTTWERLNQERQLREIWKLRKEAGKEVPRNIGQAIADQMGVSRNEVSRLHTTNENLIPEAKELVKEGKLNASQAYEMARKAPEVQKEQTAAIAGAKEAPRQSRSVNRWKKIRKSIWMKRIHSLTTCGIGQGRILTKCSAVLFAMRNTDSTESTN